MNSLDAVLAGVVLVYAGVGALRGALRELLSLVTWVIAIVMAWMFAESAGDLFARVGDPMFRHMVAFVAVFAGVFLLVSVATFVLRMLLGVSAPDTTARIAGGVLGAARGAAMLVVIVLLAGLTAFPQKPVWRDSEFVGYFQSLALSLQGMLPAEVARQFRYS